MAERNKHVPVMLPVRGLNTIEPLTIDWNSGFAREFTNYVLYNGRVYVRPAIRRDTYNSNLNEGIVWFDVTTKSSGWYVITAGGNIRKLSDNSGASGIGGTPSYNATQCKHSSLDLVIGLREPRAVTNPFGAWSFTTLGITATDIRAACSHRHRLYVCNANTIEYSTIDAITGTMDGSFSLASLLDGQNILRMFSVTISPADTTQNVLAIFGDGGKVLVYQGDYPNSANWSIIGKFDMPRPPTNVMFLEIDGDIFVGGRDYAYWFRDLFNGGAQAAYLNSPSAPIQNIWQGSAWTSNSSVHYNRYLDAIVVHYANVSQYVPPIDYSAIAAFNTYTQISFAYFKRYKAWAVWLSPWSFQWPVIADGVTTGSNLYGVNSNSGIFVSTPGSIVDQFSLAGVSADHSIEATWKTPYYPEKDRGHKLSNARVFFENTVSGYFEKIRAIFDFSDYNSQFGWYTQSTVTAVNPANYVDSALDVTAVSSNQYNQLTGVSGRGGTFSLQLTQKSKSGASASHYQSIYGATLYLEDGSSLF